MRAALEHPSQHQTRAFPLLEARRGMSLLELMVAITVGVLLFGAVTIGIGSALGVRAKGTAGELGGVIRSLYDTATLTGKTCRLVFELADERNEKTPSKYWAECAAGNITTSRKRDEQIKGDTKKLEQERRNAERQNGFRLSGAGEPSLQELLGKEKDRVENSAKFASFTNNEIEPRDLPDSVRLSVWTRHQHAAVKEGLAYLYFFPQGFTEKAMIFVRQGKNVWTLSVAPLTGKTSVIPEALEIPRS